jgi:hypothetical protein
VDPSPKESESFGCIRIRKESSDSDTDLYSDSDTVVNENLCAKSKIKHLKDKNLIFFY